MNIASYTETLNKAFDEFGRVNSALELFVSNSLDNSIFTDVIQETMGKYNISENNSLAETAAISKKKNGDITSESSHTHGTLAKDTLHRIRLLLCHSQLCGEESNEERDYEINVLHAINVPLFYQHTTDETLKTSIQQDHAKLINGPEKDQFLKTGLAETFKIYAHKPDLLIQDIETSARDIFNSLVKLGNNDLEISKLRVVESYFCVKESKVDLSNQFITSSVDHLKVAGLYLSGGQLETGPFLGANYFLNKMPACTP
jgi:hypothetical protein